MLPRIERSPRMKGDDRPGAPSFEMGAAFSAHGGLTTARRHHAHLRADAARRVLEVGHRSLVTGDSFVAARHLDLRLRERLVCHVGTSVKELVRRLTGVNHRQRATGTGEGFFLAHLQAFNGFGLYQLG